jgi:hypothetical protein
MHIYLQIRPPQTNLFYHKFSQHNLKYKEYHRDLSLIPPHIYHIHRQYDLIYLELIYSPDLMMMMMMVMVMFTLKDYN